MKSLDSVLPVLRNNLAKTKMLSKMLTPSANMTEGIKKIRDVIEETRTLVKRVRCFSYLLLPSVGFES